MGKIIVIDFNEIRKMRNIAQNKMDYSATDIIRDRFVLASYIVDMLC